MKKNTIPGLLILLPFFLAGMIAVATHGNVVERDISRLSPALTEQGTVAGETIEGVQFVVNNGQTRVGFVFDLVGRTTALDLLKRLSLQQNMPIQTKQYDFGTLVESVNGVKNGDNNSYWLYYVNDQQPTVSMDSYVVKPGDVIEMRFEKSQS